MNVGMRGQEEGIPPAGVEHLANSPGKTAVCERGGAESGAVQVESTLVSCDLPALAHAILSLLHEDRARLASLHCCILVAWAG